MHKKKGRCIKCNQEAMLVKQTWKRYAISILIPLVVGALAGFLTMDAMETFRRLEKPPLTPPAAVFPVVWTILYSFMGISAALVAGKPDRKKALAVYGAQLLMNFVWTLLFFLAKQYFFAFVWLVALWSLIVWMIVLFYKRSPVAALLQVPYLLWVTFAGYLNVMIWLLN